MKFKITFLSACMIMLFVTSKAQTASMSSGGTTFGIRAGVNFQNINGKDGNGNKLEYNLKPGFNAGVNAEIPVAPDYYVQPGVLFSTKGTKFDDDSKLNLSYVEIPVNFLYKPTLGANKLLLGFGPYVGFGIGGKLKPNTGNDRDVTFKNSITNAELLSGNVFARRLDAGANFLAGYELSSKLSFQLNAQLGLVKINPEYDGNQNDKSSWKNTGFGISAGYRF